MPVQAGTGKVNEFADLLPGDGTRPTSTTCRSGIPTAVTPFLAQCNSVVVGSLGQHHDAAGTELADDAPVLRQLRHVQPRRQPRTRGSAATSRSTRPRGGVPRPRRLRHLAADQLPPGRGERRHVRRLGPVHQRARSTCTPGGRSAPAPATNRSTPTASDPVDAGTPRRRLPIRQGLALAPRMAPVPLHPALSDAATPAESSAGPEPSGTIGFSRRAGRSFWAFGPGIGPLRFRGGRTRSAGRSAPALWVGGTAAGRV